MTHTGVQHKHALATVHGAECLFTRQFQQALVGSRAKKKKILSHPWRFSTRPGRNLAGRAFLPRADDLFFSFGPKKKKRGACVQKQAKRDTRPGLTGLGVCPGGKSYEREKENSCALSLHITGYHLAAFFVPRPTRDLNQGHGLLRCTLCCRSVNQHMHSDRRLVATPRSAQVNGLASRSSLQVYILDLMGVRGIRLPVEKCRAERLGQYSR